MDDHLLFYVDLLGTRSTIDDPDETKIQSLEDLLKDIAALRSPFNRYYYKKERDGSRVKSIYVGRGEIAHMISQIQSDSPLLERLARSIKSSQVLNEERRKRLCGKLTIVNGSGQGMRECWRQRLKAMRNDLGYAESSPLERLLIQQVRLCWPNLNLTEYRHTNVMKQSISFACGLYWEKRLTAAQRCFTRACETLARVKRLAHHTPSLQLNIAAEGGQQLNLSGSTMTR